MNIKLKKKKLKTGKYSWYIEEYLGSTKTEQGKVRHNRNFDFLKIYTYVNPKTPQEKNHNREKELLAEQILKIREAEIIQGKYEIPNKYNSKILLLDYFEQLVKENQNKYSKGTWSAWDSCYKHLQKFSPPGVTLQSVDVKFVQGYKDYLDNYAYTKSKIKLKSASKFAYFSKFKCCLNQAYEKGLIKGNPGKAVPQFKVETPERAYLTIDELRVLERTELKYPVLKRAFLFSCLTGLRWSDVQKLRWKEVHDEPTGSRVIFRQQKTKGQAYLDINSEAREYLGERGSIEQRVFVGLNYSSAISNELLRWCLRAGITKHITFHCARHTNAVLLLENGADIYTVKERLGHKHLKTTEIYTKIINRKMYEAAHCIPSLKL